MPLINDVKNTEETNYNDFQIFMEDIFDNVYDEEWMSGSRNKADRADSEATHLAKKINAESHKEKYEEKVKAYTNYLIGRKIS
jgi:secreted Zn-dependent insulinase-like peptidase